MQNKHGGKSLTEQRARAAALLSRFPSLSDGELSELKNWFGQVASSLDVGLIASDPKIETQYRAFRKDHLDRMKTKDWLVGMVIVATVCAVIAVVALHSG